MGNDSGASGTSFAGDNESSMEGADGKLEEEEDSGGLKTVAWSCGHRNSQKAQVWGKGVRRQQLGDGDGSDNVRRQQSGN